MSADTHGNAAPHGHGGDAHGHATRKGYLTGFFLSVVLTAIPFWLVMSGAMAPATTAYTIMGFALVQVVVHMIYFLHMNSSSQQGWTLMALIFTLIVVAIALTGSLWVMHHMNVNMIPGMIPGDTAGM